MFIAFLAVVVSVGFYPITGKMDIWSIFFEGPPSSSSPSPVEVKHFSPKILKFFFWGGGGPAMKVRV